MTNTRCYGKLGGGVGCLDLDDCSSARIVAGSKGVVIACSFPFRFSCVSSCESDIALIIAHVSPQEQVSIVHTQSRCRIIKCCPCLVNAATVMVQNAAAKTNRARMIP